MNLKDIELTDKWKEIAERTKEERSLNFEEYLIDAIHRAFNKMPGHLDYYDGLVIGVISAIEFMGADESIYKKAKKRVLED